MKSADEWIAERFVWEQTSEPYPLGEPVLRESVTTRLVQPLLAKDFRKLIEEIQADARGDEPIGHEVKP